MTVSVCTLARGRQPHLRNLVSALRRQTQRPAELVIAHMQPEPYEALPPCPFPVRQVEVSGDRLPLAAGRNAAAAAAGGTALVFLDVDCVPAPDLIAAYRAALEPDRCLMGDTRYLAQADDPAHLGFDELWHRSIRHPARRFDNGTARATRRLPDCRDFWSLSFALSAETFQRIGGFDERFDGYGGEDTDFAMALDRQGVSLYWVPAARAVHQWHPVQVPPLDQFDDILRNAELFHRKHGQWCMEYWLDQFAARGLIRRADDRLDVLRRPSAHERQAARQNGSVRFS